MSEPVETHVPLDEWPDHLPDDAPSVDVPLPEHQAVPIDTAPIEDVAVPTGEGESPADEVPTGEVPVVDAAAAPGSARTSTAGWSDPSPGARGVFEQWSVLALVAALIGALPLAWPVPILSLLAVAFGLVGVANCQADGRVRNRWMAVLAVAIGLATLTAVALLTSLDRLQFLPFWTTQ
ncbi:MAG: hypothetical protein JWM12_3087 [Ilumatobacteraceae bacterium]|nr:hypothetical protein [Ilumatobacteraceae bacterium]